MPGYIIHLAHGMNIISELEKKNFKIGNDWKNRFLTGILLPDTKITGSKKESHFWNEKSIPLLARKPDISLFLKKYKNKSDNPIVMGYYAHLLLDVHFIDDYWADEFEFYNKNDEIEDIFDKVTYVKIKNTKETVPIKQFLSIDYYYGDYSKTNEYYIQKYNIRFPDMIFYENPIEEVDIKDMRYVFDNLNEYCIGGSVEDVEKLKVFNLAKLDDIIEKNTDIFEL
jgi:hypothetical protein